MNFDDLINELSRDVERVEKLPGKEVTDKTEILVSLCVNLEAIFKSGLKSSFKITALSYREYWHFFKDISYYGKKRRNIDLYFCSLVEKISQEKSVITNSGRGRLIIRSLLKNRMLSNLFKFIRENNDIVAKNYYKDNALLLSSSFLFKINDIILRLDKCLFSINLLNSDFLEISWYLPIYEKFQFVPCKSLGLSIRSISGHHFIELIDPFGVVGENGKLISGDIVSRIFDNSIRFYPGLIRNLLELYKNKPISIWVCKLYRSDGNLYQPILDILNRENMTKIIHKKIPTNPQVNENFREEINNDENHIPLSNIEINSSRPHQLNTNCKYRFVGSIEVGTDGSVERISDSIGKIFRDSESINSFKPVAFKFGEICLEVIDNSDNKSEYGKLMFTHAFSRISSCGRRTDIPRYFAYIVGNTSCALANSFTAYVFEAYTGNDAKSLIKNIADGFERTHWTV